jgi:PAS domain S-box-containing protein
METETTPQTASKAKYEPTGTDRIRQRFETAAELANDGLLVCDQAGNIVYASTAASKLLGFKRDELTSMNVRGLLSLADQRNFDILRKDAVSQPGQTLTTEANAIPAWGQALEVEIAVIASPQGDELFISLRDLSLSKIMEKELLKSNQFLRKIIIGSVDGIIAADVSGNIMLFNEGAVRMLGWDEVEVIGVKTVADFLEPGVADEVQIRLHRDDPRDGPTGSMNPLEVNMVARSGEIFPVSLTMSSIVEWGQEVATVGIFTDLRERVKMERALKETRDYLNNVLENAFDMIITTDLNTNIVSFNRGAERLLGYRRDEVLGKSVESFYPDAEERRALMRRMEHFDGVVSNYETRLIRKDGVLVDISMTLSLLYDNQGKIIGTVGISKDITARKRAERELQETKDYLNAIVENAPDMIITTNLEKKMVSFNRGAEKILGYHRQEVLGHHIETLYVEPGERQALAKYLDSQTGSVNYETQLRSKDGRVVDIDLTLSHLKNKDGQVIGTLGISKDITEKKRVEAELEQKKSGTGRSPAPDHACRKNGVTGEAGHLRGPRNQQSLGRHFAVLRNDPGGSDRGRPQPPGPDADPGTNIALQGNRQGVVGIRPHDRHPLRVYRPEPYRGTRDCAVRQSSHFAGHRNRPRPGPQDASNHGRRQPIESGIHQSDYQRGGRHGRPRRADHHHPTG